MTHHIHYEHMSKFLSSARINAINNAFGGKLTTKQIFGIFFWEQQIASAIYPIIQIVEISLRNSMNQVLKTRFGQNSNWWTQLKATDTCSATIREKCKCTLCDIKESIIKAENRFKREYKITKKISYSGNVSLDDMISHTELYLWELLLSSKLYSPSNSKNQEYLYPISLTKIFKGCSNLYPNLQGKNKKILAEIKTLVYNVRQLRNRISHHDRLWTKSHLSGDFITRKNAVITSISKKIDDIKNLALAISPTLLNMIENWGLFNNIYEILSLDILERYLDENFFKFSSAKEQKIFLDFSSKYKIKCYPVSRRVAAKKTMKK